MKKYKPLTLSAALTAGLVSVNPALADTVDATTPGPQGSGEPFVLLPNLGARALTTPTAWGSHSGTVYGAIGYTNPQAFSENDDSVVSIGAGVGDPTRLGGLQLGVSMNDVSGGDNFSFNARLHKYLGHGISVAVGGENLFPDSENDADESFYGVISRASQRWRGKDTGRSRLNVSLGVGSGRFANKSPADEAAGNGENGTVVFSAVAFEVLRNINLIADWNGTNLAAGIGLSPSPRLPVSIVLGAADLTDNSGDDVRFIGSFTIGFKPFGVR